MSTYPPTTEQQLAIDAFTTGSDLVVEAGAGTGKTSTLVLMAEATDRRGQYIAFNKSIVKEGEARFPSTVACNTAHSLAFRAVGRKYAKRLQTPRQRSQDIAAKFGIDPIMVSGKRLAPGYLAGVCLRAISNFCMSDADAPSVRNVPFLDGIDGLDGYGRQEYTNNNYVAAELLNTLQDMWRDIVSLGGFLQYKHDYYLKVWQLCHPRIEADYILFDEAQDANPVMLAIVAEQADHAQLVYVGDTQQQIYGWNGAVNAMANTGIENRVYLSKSFRFGPAIADMANLVLDRLDAELRLTGHDPIPSEVHIKDAIEAPTAYLARTNASAVRRLFAELAADGHPHLVGGGGDIAAFTRGARDLQNGRRTSHFELACFESWAEVQEYVKEDQRGDELRLLVSLVDDFGTEAILAALDHMPSEEKATLVISTGHKAKGREWDSVQLAPDFRRPKDGSEPSPEEYRLLYVAVTRAKLHLDVSMVELLGGTDPDKAVTAEAQA